MKNNNETTFLIALLFTLLYHNSYAQTITGLIKNQQDSVVNFCNIALYKGDTIVKGVTSFDGKFAFEQVNPGNYKLCISHISYTDTCLNINNLSKNIELQVLLNTKNTQIGEINIVEKRPDISIENNKVVMRVENTVLSQSQFAEDVIMFLPGTIKTKNGLEIFGKGSPVYYINGVEVFSYTEVELISPDEIERVELSYSSANIDASKQCSINIITKQNADNLNFRIYNRGQYYDKYYHNISRMWLKYNKNKFQHVLFYDGLYGKSYWEEGSTSGIYNNNQQFYSSSFDMTTVDKNNNNTSFYKLTYTPDTNQRVGLLIDGTFSKPKSDYIIESKVNNNNSYSEKMYEDYNYYDIHTSAFYDLTTKNSSNLMLLLDYYNSDSDGQTDINEILGKSILASKSTYNIYAGSVNYNFQLFNDKTRLNIGSKYYYTTNKNNNNYSSDYTGQAATNSVFTSNNSLTEKSLAGFMQVENNYFEKISLQAGVRFESYARDINDYTNDTAVNREKNYFYPSIAVSYMPLEYMQIMVGYSKNINRQAYDYISGQNIYINPYMYKIGNPYLEPEIADNYYLNFLLGQAIDINIAFVDRKNYTSMVFFATDSIVKISYKNYDKKDFNVGLNLSSHSDDRRFSLGANMNKPFFKYEYLGQQVINDIVNFNFTLQLFQKFLKTYQVIINFQYNTKTQFDVFTYQPQITGEIGLCKFFLKDKLRFALAYQFNQTEKYDMRYEQLKMSHYYNKEITGISFSIMYSLNFNSWTTKETAIEDELNRIN